MSNKEIKLNGISIPEKYIKPSLTDNLKYINDTVSHIEINRIYGAGPIMYQVVCKAKTINVITGNKSFVTWAVQEGADLETAVQKAKDELQNRIVVGMPVFHYASPDENIKNITEY